VRGRGWLAARGPLVSSARTPKPTPEGSTTLDDPNTTPRRTQPPRAKRSQPPGLREQIAATRDAAMALVMAHVELAKAEMGSIAGEIGRTIALGLVALVLVLFALSIALIGTALTLGEWLLGSIGWGTFHGVLAFLAIALAAVLLAVGVPGRRIGRSFLVALAIGLVVGLVLGANLLNQAYVAIGDSSGASIDPGVRPLVIGLVAGAIVGLLAGIVAGATAVHSGGGRAGAIIGLIVVGAALGAFTAITFGPQLSAAVGITAGYIAWIALMGIDVARTGIDVERLKQRFYPAQTIDTSKETLEWLQKRMPPGIGS
jgi:hypothetical protein